MCIVYMLDYYYKPLLHGLYRNISIIMRTILASKLWPEVGMYKCLVIFL